VANKKQPDPKSTREQLQALVRELERKNAELAKKNADLTKENAELLKEIQSLKRAQHRQATPFSKDRPVKDPKKPGRKKGQGPFRRRETPAQHPTVTVNAEAPPECPFCGGPLEHQGEESATTTDVPRQPQPEVTSYRVAVCRCGKCGKTVRGTAPGLAADQYGATAHRVGPGVMAAAQALHYQVGIPVRRVPGVLRELTGVTITQSALTQDALRRAKAEVGAEYGRLRAAVKEAPFVHTDDTGWKVGGKTAFLMGFDTDRVTVYQIRAQHRNEEVRELIPGDYAGIMITDRGKSYDAEEFQAVSQQKCLGHILRNIAEVVETKQGRAQEFGLHAKSLFQESMELWKARDTLEAEAFNAKAAHLADLLSYHLRERTLTDSDNQRLLNGLGAHDDQGHLMRFLQAPFVEPTNNRAERILRPAVIARKVSQCSKNQQGAEAFAAFASIAQTAVKNGAVSVAAAFYKLFTAPDARTTESPPT
jgi:transposase